MKFHAAKAANMPHALDLLAENARRGRTCIGIVASPVDLRLFFRSEDSDEPGSAPPVGSCCNMMVTAVERSLLLVHDGSRTIAMSRQDPGVSSYASIKFCPWCGSETR